MKIEAQKRSIDGLSIQKYSLVFFIIITCAVSKLYGQTQQQECDIRMNAVVSSSGNLSNDGKGTYYTGKDWVGIWLNTTRWPDQAFHFCLLWPFNYFKTCDSATAPSPSGTRGDRTLLHHMINPVPGGGGKSLGVFTGPGGGNDIMISKPLTAAVNNFTDMAIGSSLLPLSTEVRFCNSDCSEYYSLLFGDSSVFHIYDPSIYGAGSTRPIVTRISDTTWTITFPPGTVGRLWNRTPAVPTSAFYYYEGSIEITKQ